MSTERLNSGGYYVQMQSEATSFRHTESTTRMFDELPSATIVQVSRPDASDITPMLLTYTIEFSYKQFKWQLKKKAAEVFYLHFALKKRVFIEEIHEKQEQVKEWLQNLGIGEHTGMVHNENEHDDDETVPLNHDGSVRNRDVPSRAALPIIRPELGRQHSISDRARVAMQEYLNQFLGNLDIVNSREVCKFLEVSRLSFSTEYGSKQKEDYVMVNHLSTIPDDDDHRTCSPCQWFNCCNDKWQKVWAVLKPGFLALLKDPFDPEPLDIIIFDLLPASDGIGGRVPLAVDTKERNPLRHSFEVFCGNRSIRLRCKNTAKVKEWVSAINDAALRLPEGWCHPHRFGSYAPPRGLTEDGSEVQWFVDGQAAFDSIALAIDGANSEIYICGWWVCPELYLRRPFHAHASSKLDALLEAKAKRGVQIYILLYKEVALALKINSMYSKRKLLGIHENIRVLRYPDHFSSGVYLWSHHEKLVIIDNHICFIGGLDLCYGRYDSSDHKVGDLPANIWPGKDYYNPRESEPNNWEDTMTDEIDREQYPRMPWHDVHCALWGPPCRDVARHFVQRWNYAKRSKAPNEQTVPLLMPQQHMVIPHYMRSSNEMVVDRRSAIDTYVDIKRQDSDSSLSSFQDIPLLIPQEADGSGASNEDSKSRKLEMGHDFDEQSSRDGKDLSRDVLLSGNRTTEKEWSETQEQDDRLVSADEPIQVGPRVSCRCQVIRSISQWSAGTSQVEESIHRTYCSLIEKAEHFVYIENQFFISGLKGDETIQNRVLESMYRRILRAHHEKKLFRVIIVIPLLPGFQGGIDDAGAASVRAIMHWQYRTICRGQNSILHNLHDLLGARVHDYISFYGLRSYGRLSDSSPVASSQVYVHSKVMIIDDCAVLIGSANINDRSLLGSRDSEIGVLIEDKELFDSYMGGKPWKAGKFASSLRHSLWSEHLGLQAEELSQIIDPVIDSTYKDIWMATAKTNTMIYQDVISCIPNDLVQSRAALRESMTYWKQKLGHTTIDLGIAPMTLESYQDGNITEIDPMERLKSVKGHLVSFPLKFMCEEDLRPGYNESEYYASPQIFH
ncbi:phospholipase D zeta 1-like isoform X2 [Apium graveolens]|uniref:phospholipase D zeta 1-like isoform X2 n=1 Tax=Apium graveolens TaxID=4045 RepID=UPI003D7978F2